MEIFVSIIICLGALVFMLMSAHCAEEQRQGRYIPLPWEKKKRKLFDKSNIKYRDGDNT